MSCGARSQLTLDDHCAEVGATRPCENACGSGVQSCRDGQWSTCEVPDAERPCRDTCGSGTQHCTAGAWGICQVPDIWEECRDECGEGLRVCRGGEWSVCEVPERTVECESVCGKGKRTCSGGKWGACTAPQPKPPRLSGTLRDFADPYGGIPNDPNVRRHPDFELRLSGDHLERGLVERNLGPDDKPVYMPLERTVTTSGAANFDQWYRDTPGVNQSMSVEFQLQPASDDPGLYVYSSNQFFPLDGQLLGNQGRSHNFGFTLETVLYFRYIGGEVFRFRGDDDLWIFINRRLAIDLGGLHRSLEGSVELDQKASELGLQIGRTYPLHLFFAERHTIESNFSVETTLADPGTCE